MLPKEKRAYMFLYITCLVFGLLVLIYVFNPFGSGAKTALAGQISRQQYINQVIVNTPAKLCTIQGFLKLNSCTMFSQEDCYKLVVKEAKKCANYNKDELPEFIGEDQKVLKDRWELQFARCVGRASMNVLKEGKTIQTINCMKGIISYD